VTDPMSFTMAGKHYQFVDFPKASGTGLEENNMADNSVVSFDAWNSCFSHDPSFWSVLSPFAKV
jgi:hypothetical protein